VKDMIFPFKSAGLLQASWSPGPSTMHNTPLDRDSSAQMAQGSLSVKLKQTEQNLIFSFTSRRLLARFSARSLGLLRM